MKRLLLLLGILVFFTACVQQGIGTDGLVTNSFSVEPQTAEVDDSVRFFLDFENTGGTTARCIIAELYGLDSWLTEDGLPLSTARPWRNRAFSFSYYDNTFNLCYYDFKNGIDACGSYSKDGDKSLSVFISESWNSFLSDFCESYRGVGAFPEARFFSSLSPPLPQRNRPGQSQTVDWAFRPPVLPEGLKVDYPVTARVSYAYTSTANVNIRAFSKEEFRRRQNIGEQIDSSIDTVNSFGAPIQVNVAKGSAPIIVNEDGIDPIQTENFLIEFANVGNGFPLPSVDLDSGFVFATAEVNGPGVYFEDCLGQRGGREAFDQSIVGNLVKIRDGSNTAPFSCTIGIDRTIWRSTPVGTISITFNVFYRYYTDTEIQASVLGLENS